MSVFTGKLFALQNSSMLLRTGQALRATVSKLNVLDTGIGKPCQCSENELTKPSRATGGASSVTVGYLVPSTSRTRRREKSMAENGNETLVHDAFRMVSGAIGAGSSGYLSLRDSQRMFIDMMTGDDFIRMRAIGRAKDLLGCPTIGQDRRNLFIPPRTFRQMRVWVELYKSWRYNKKVKGFVIDRVRGGYAVAIAGYVAFIPASLIRNKRIINSTYIIENINPKKLSMVVR